MVVEAGDTNSQAVADLAEQVWRKTIYALRSKRTGEAISHNVARLFPLNEPHLIPSYRVQRTSVRDLLRAFDRTNGVRLWCSVRRSGKTTACFGLDYTAADSVIVPQTCGTGPTDNARIFFDKVREAAASGSHLAADFVETSVAECAPYCRRWKAQGSDNRRIRNAVCLPPSRSRAEQLRTVHGRAAVAQPARRVRPGQPAGAPRTATRRPLHSHGPESARPIRAAGPVPTLRTRRWHTRGRVRAVSRKGPDEADRLRPRVPHGHFITRPPVIRSSP